MTSTGPYGEPVLTTTVEQVDSRIYQERQNKLNVLKSMGGIQVTTGIILAAMGGTSMVLECYLSRIGNPIWSGICFFMLTGLIGLAGTTSGKQGVITFYAICSGMSTACAGQLFSMSIYGATQEKELLCRPWVDTYKICTYVIEARIGINVCIAIVAFIALIACLTASCVTCTIPPPARTQVVIRAAPQPRPVEPSPGATFVPMDPTKPYGSVEPPPYSNE